MRVKISIELLDKRDNSYFYDVSFRLDNINDMETDHLSHMCEEMVARNFMCEIKGNTLFAYRYYKELEITKLREEISYILSLLYRDDRNAEKVSNLTKGKGGE